MITQGNRLFWWKSRAFTIWLVATLSACAAPNGALQQAREAYEETRQDSRIANMAPVELEKANETITRAEQAKNRKETAHLAHIAQKQLEIARAEAQRKEAEAALDQLIKERDRILLEARTSEARALADELAELKAEQTERGYVMTLGDVLFDYNRASLKSGAQLNLSRLISFLAAHPEQNILIEGHTDNTGSESYNQNLSERRALAVQNFLISNGANPQRITAQGYGESYPVASNSNEAGRQQNRRVEIVFPKTGQTGYRPPQ
jgi:outer membrane protein OmpA-like peptidoglycan-associated protein